MFHLLSTACVAVLLSVATPTASAAAEYRIVTLAPEGFAVSTAVGVNNRGQVAGWAESSSGLTASGFVYDNGRYSWFSGPSEAKGSFVTDVSDDGIVVGSYFSRFLRDPNTGGFDRGPTSGFLFSEGAYSLVAVPDAYQTYVRGISPNGRYVSGWYLERRDGPVAGFVLDRQTGVWAYMPSETLTSATLQGVDNVGFAVGSDLVDLSTVPYMRGPVTFDSSTGIRTELQFGDLRMAVARDRNASGIFVGWFATGSAFDQAFSFVGTPDSFELFGIAGSFVTQVQGINDAGWLSGGYEDGFSDGSYGFLAIPVPEPGALTLFIAGLAWLSLRQGARKLLPVPARLHSHANRPCKNQPLGVSIGSRVR
jgi:hypothetical protein